MGFMDKVKAQAEQVAGKAQQGLAQGQAKLNDMQIRRRADALLRELGAAYYAEQRSSGDRGAVEHALAAVDAHVAEHGPLGGAAEPEEPGGAGEPSSPAGPAAPSGTDAPAGD